DRGDGHAFGTDVAVRVWVVYIGLDREDAAAVDLELQAAPGLAQIATAQHGRCHMPSTWSSHHRLKAPVRQAGWLGRRSRRLASRCQSAVEISAGSGHERADGGTIGLADFHPSPRRVLANPYLFSVRLH